MGLTMPLAIQRSCYVARSNSAANVPAAGVFAMSANLSADVQETPIEYMQGLFAAMNSDRPINEVLDMVAAHSLRRLNPQDVVIARLDPDTQELFVCAAQGSTVARNASALLATGVQALTQSLQAQAPVLHPWNEYATASSLEDPASPAIFAVPLVDSSARIYGALLLFYTRDPQLSAAEVEMATFIGAQATLALKYAERTTQDYTSVILGERNRIARDLHDSVTQTLYTMSLITETLPGVWQNHRREALENIEKLHFLARNALAEMRTLLLELRPSERADRNLGDLLRQLPERMHLHSEVQVITTAVGDTPLPKPVQVALYYIAQEALNNVDKHACASRASIQLDFQPDGKVVLRVSDNGRGFDSEAHNARQLGLGIMRERACEIGALLMIESLPGQGTQVTVEWQASKQD